MWKKSLETVFLNEDQQENLASGRIFLNIKYIILADTFIPVIMQKHITKCTYLNPQFFLSREERRGLNVAAARRDPTSLQPEAEVRKYSYSHAEAEVKKYVYNEEAEVKKYAYNEEDEVKKYSYPQPSRHEDTEVKKYIYDVEAEVKKYVGHEETPTLEELSPPPPLAGHSYSNSHPPSAGHGHHVYPGGPFTAAGHHHHYQHNPEALDWLIHQTSSDYHLM